MPGVRLLALCELRTASAQITDHNVTPHNSWGPNASGDQGGCHQSALHQGHIEPSDRYDRTSGLVQGGRQLCGEDAFDLLQA